jgi:3-mercaptopyruvate sulfurtransferase SseA
LRRLSIAILFVMLPACWPATLRTLGQTRSNVNQTTLEEPAQLTPEISTDELKKVLLDRSEPFLDVRSATEYAIAHIPGSINVYEKELERVVNSTPIKRRHFSFIATARIAGKVSGFRNNW